MSTTAAVPEAKQREPTIAPRRRGSGLVSYFLEEITFFRAHLLAFTLVPLIFAAIFYGANGRYHISFIDSLFVCYSAMTVTGLSTVNLSTTTPLQQVILYGLMLVGNFTFVSWLMALVRKHFFRTHCEYIASTHQRRRPISRSRSSFLKSISAPVGAAFRQQQEVPMKEKLPDSSLNPGFTVTGPTPAHTIMNEPEAHPLSPPPAGSESRHSEESADHYLADAQTFSSSPRAVSILLSPTVQSQPRRPQALEFAFTSSMSPKDGEYNRIAGFRDGVPQPRRGMTILSHPGDPSVPGSATSHKYRGLGGFPGPIQLLSRIFKRAAPRTYRKLERKMTFETATTQEGALTSWLNFDLFVGRNSDFRIETLSDEQVEEIGGAEYRALRLLSWLIPVYFVGTQLFSFILFAPWLSATSRYDEVFEAQAKLVAKPWFSLFQVMGAYTGGGLSLVDLGMLPFQEAYLMIFGLMFAILAGNHALPIFLRFIIWVSSKLVRDGGEMHQALSFLLDHPRRCFFYLFPSHQTWFLVICLVTFSAIEWLMFGILDIGLAVYEAIPVGPRIIDGLFQGLAVRASGLAIVPIASFAPALQFLYVVMMYIAVYPVAMSIRATNVYEERSLGVFEAPPDDEDEEPEEDLSKLKSRRERIGRYLGWHVRRQLSIDIWWLVWGVFLVTIIERGNLLDQEKKWFDIFRIVFELVSAFGGIGLSLGLPTDNFSFAGAMHPLSKLVIIIIMVRGRHRGLPVAVDRAVLLPNELVVNHIDQPKPVNPDKEEPVQTQP